MLYDSRGQLAQPRQHSTCPACGQVVQAKCGEIMVWHWAHLVADCDPWAEPESQWHLEWKQRLKAAGCQVEVVMGNHRADAVTPFGAIIELQNNYQSPEKIAVRERFYGETLHWVYRCHWKPHLQWLNMDRFWWRHGSPSMLGHEQPVMWDMDGELADLTALEYAWAERRNYWTDELEEYQRIEGELDNFASHEAWIDVWTRRYDVPIDQMVDNLMSAFTANDGEQPRLVDI